MIFKLAEEMYIRSVQLKKYRTKNLLFNSQRIGLENEIKHLTEQLDTISCLVKENHLYPLENLELLLFMEEQLRYYTACLSSKPKNYRKVLCRRIWGFHNLPRAFLSEDNPMKITPYDAKKYYESYSNLN